MKNKENKKKLIILGGEGVGEIAANIAVEENIYKDIFFLNDYIKQKIGKYKKKFRVIGKIPKIIEFLKNDEFVFFNAIIDYKAKSEKLSHLFNKAKNKQVSIIHPSVNFFKDACRLEKNILLGTNVSISTGVLIKENTIAMSNVFIGHNSTIGKNCFLAASSCIGGNVKISNNCFVGLNSTIREFSKMKKFSLLGAHSLLMGTTGVGETWVGSPAKKI